MIKHQGLVLKNTWHYRTTRRRYVRVSWRGLQAYLVTRSTWAYFDKSIAIGPWNCSAQIRRIREMHLTKMRNTNLEKFQNTPAPDSWRRSSEKTSSCGVKINIDSGVKCMAGKPMKTRIRVWREFGGGRKRGGGRPPGKIISWNSVDCSAGRGVWKTDKNTLTWGRWLVNAFYILSLFQVWSVWVIMETLYNSIAHFLLNIVQTRRVTP